MKKSRWIPRALALIALLAAGAAPRSAASAQAAPEGEQAVLGPGLYVFQTRTRSASCADDERTGYVSSFFASINGVPGGRSMQMNLLSSPYWSTWTVSVSATGEITGDAFLNGSSGPSRPTSHFAVTRQGERFTGEGMRSYDATIGGTTRRCVVTYDALLRRIDV